MPKTKRTFRVVTEKRFCKETGRAPCHNKPFGYVIQITPPIVCFSATQVVVFGFVYNYPPKRWEQHTAGWCKYRDRAIQRLPDIVNSEYYNRDDQPTPKQLDLCH